MNPLAELVRGQAAEIIARFGTVATLCRGTGGFDADTQSVPPGEVACAVPAFLHRWSGGSRETALRGMEAYVTLSDLQDAGFPAPPRPGDRLTVDGEELPILEVETWSAGDGALYLLKAGQ